MHRLVIALWAASPLLAQLHPLPAWRMTKSAIAITRHAQFPMPFSVAAEHGAIFGSQDGVFEAWSFPIKVLSHFRISAALADYPVPIDLNEYAAQIEVNPERTTITYSHAAFTVKQHMFSPRGDSVSGAGAIVLFEIDSIRPLELTFQFTPEVLRMWPASSFGRPNAEWVDKGGYYILHTDREDLAGCVAIPGAQPGILAPYQERPKTYPVQLKLQFDPKKDAARFYPLLMISAASKDCPGRLNDLNARVEPLYRSTLDYYAHFFDHRLTAETPDHRFDDGIKWAEIAIDQAQVRYHDETGLVAGYHSSGDSARPGYGWFFGRDTEFSLYAINSSGDFTLARHALDFLFTRQREDGKIMHEFSQSADQLDWKATSYFYASADSTPLLVMAMLDYVTISGDRSFLAKHWDGVKRAYAFQRAHDPDGDGIYNNSEGTGWVESWPGGMPNQEVYLASLDQQSAAAIARLATLMNEPGLARQAIGKAAEIRAKLTSEYLDPKDQFYAFSRNADGSLDHTASIYPAVAWWNGTLSLPDAGAMLDRWASHEFSTDWGLRDISEKAPIYDPISYHQGTVWPLFTGWVSLAEFRAGRPMAAREHLYENLLLTWAQDLGSCTELLSGAFYQPLGRSSSHQTWSSAMVLTPAVRGLLGLDWDATRHTLAINPNLPPDWDYARVQNIPLGAGYISLDMTRQKGSLVIHAHDDRPFRLCRELEKCTAAESDTGELTIALPAVEIGTPLTEAEPGAETSRLKVLHQDEHSVTFEAKGPSIWTVPIRINASGVRIRGGTISNGKLQIEFNDPGWSQVRVSW